MPRSNFLWSDACALKRILLLCTSIFLLPGVSVSALEYVLIQPTIGNVSVDPPQMSADGKFVAMTARTEGSGFRGNVWSRAGAKDLGVLPGDVESQAWDISADGSVVTGSSISSTGDWEAFVWTPTNGMTGLGVLPTYDRSLGVAVSADGATMVGYAFTAGTINQNKSEAYRWTQHEGMVGLGIPSGMLESQARDVSADGRVIAIGAWQNDSLGRDSNYRSFLWTEASGFEDLGPLPAGWGATHARHLSSDGNVLLGNGGPGNGITRPFLWSRETGIKPLPILEGAGSYNEVYPLMMTADAQIVVGNYLPYGNPHVPFVWDAEHGTRDLRQVLVEDHGLTQLPLDDFSVRAISADGRTVMLRTGALTGDVDTRQHWAVYLDKPLVSTFPGDFNGDGTVDAADYVVWRNGLGTTYTQSHYDQWRANFGQTAAGAAAVADASAGTGVPEPNALVLSAMALLMCRMPGPFTVLFRRRR